MTLSTHKHAEPSHWHDKAALQGLCWHFHLLFHSVLSLPPYPPFCWLCFQRRACGFSGRIGRGHFALWPSCFMDCVGRGIFAILYYSFDCLRETFKITQFTCVFSPSRVSEIRLLDYNLNVHEFEPENLVFSVYIFHTPPPPPPCMERERQSTIIVMTVPLLTFWQNGQEYCCLCMPSFVEFLGSAIAEYPSHSHDNNFNREEHPDQHRIPYTCPPLVSLSCLF